MGCLLFVLSLSLFAQEGNRTTIDMLGGGSQIYGLYYDFDPISETEWGWKEGNVTDDLRLSKRTDKSEVDPHAGFLAIPQDRVQSYRLATKQYAPESMGFQTAAGGRIYFEYTVSENNAIAMLDYAAMLEYAGHQMSLSNADWQYYQPWVRMYVTVLDPATNQWSTQGPTVIIHAWQAPTGTQGWKQPSTADGWVEGDVALYDATTAGFIRNMHLLVKDWSRVGLDLRACIGYKIRVMAEYHDCAVSSENATWDNYYTYQYNFCEHHHLARLYTTLACTQALLQKEDETCDPATVTYSAPEGFSYRWYTASNPNATLSTSQTCKYTFASGDEQTELVCEIKSPTNMTATTLSVPLQNKCACHATFNFPEYVCADANTLDIDYEYTSGSAKSFDVTFNDEALMRGFNNLTNQPVSLGNRISIPMPAANGTQYVRPNQYMMTLRVHQSSGMDTVMTKTFEVRYPSWLIQQRWNDVLALYNSNYNGGYYFSAVQWYQAGMPVATGSPSETYIYRPEGLNTETDYWVALTRADDGKTFCSCPLRPVVKNFAPERKKAPIDLSASDNNRMRVRVTTDRSGQYIVYSPAGQALLKGYFGTAYGSPDITLPAQGTFVLRFVADDGTEETLKWIAY